MALTKITGEGVGDLDTLTVDGDVTLNDGSPNLRLQDTDTSRYIDVAYGTRAASFTNTMASGEDMDTVQPWISFRFKDDSETRDYMRIVGSSGNVLVGTTTANPADANDASGAQISQAGTIQASASASTPAIFNRGGDGNVIGILKAGVVVGTVSVSGSSTAYNTSSDYRLKENVTYDWDATTRLKQLKPARFNFIADADTTVDGFLAHEAQAVVPEAVTGTKDAMRDEEYEIKPAVLDDDGNEVTPAEMGTRSVPDYQGIDQSKLVPLLVKTLQEAITKIETLEAKVQALEDA